MGPLYRRGQSLRATSRKSFRSHCSERANEAKKTAKAVHEGGLVGKGEDVAEHSGRTGRHERGGRGNPHEPRPLVGRQIALGYLKKRERGLRMWSRPGRPSRISGEASRPAAFAAGTVPASRARCWLRPARSRQRLWCGLWTGPRNAGKTVLAKEARFRPAYAGHCGAAGARAAGLALVDFGDPITKIYQSLRVRRNFH